MDEWFTLQEHPDNHMLYVQETFVDDTRPIRYTIWHPTRFDARVYRASFGAARVGKPLVPTEGPALTFRFEDMPGAEIIAIDEHVLPLKTQEELLPPAIQECYWGIIIPEWHEGAWMYYSATDGWRTLDETCLRFLLEPEGNEIRE